MYLYTGILVCYRHVGWDGLRDGGRGTERDGEKDIYNINRERERERERGEKKEGSVRERERES